MDGGIPEQLENAGSELDELTHAEGLVLYRESTESIRYAKTLQWKTLTFLAAIFGALILIADTRLTSAGVVPVMIIVSFVVSGAGISALLIFQMWQSTEFRKLDFIAQRMSGMFREARAIKSNMEANIHRYALLTFMVVFIGCANGITFLILSRFLDP